MDQIPGAWWETNGVERVKSTLALSGRDRRFWNIPGSKKTDSSVQSVEDDRALGAVVGRSHENHGQEFLWQVRESTILHQLWAGPLGVKRKFDETTTQNTSAATKKLVDARERVGEKERIEK